MRGCNSLFQCEPLFKIQKYLIALKVNRLKKKETSSFLWVKECLYYYCLWPCNRQKTKEMVAHTWTLSIYQMLSSRIWINLTKGMRKIILLCWFDSFTCSPVHSVNPQTQATATRRYTNRLLFMFHRFHVFKTTKNETEVKKKQTARPHKESKILKLDQLSDTHKTIYRTISSEPKNLKKLFRFKSFLCGRNISNKLQGEETLW